MLTDLHPVWPGRLVSEYGRPGARYDWRRYVRRIMYSLRASNGISCSAPLVGTMREGSKTRNEL
jgi:hypothetical protein